MCSRWWPSAHSCLLPRLSNNQQTATPAPSPDRATRLPSSAPPPCMVDEATFLFQATFTKATSSSPRPSFLPCLLFSPCAKGLFQDSESQSPVPRSPKGGTRSALTHMGDSPASPPQEVLVPAGLPLHLGRHGSDLRACASSTLLPTPSPAIPAGCEQASCPPSLGSSTPGPGGTQCVLGLTTGPSAVLRSQELGDD